MATVMIHDEQRKTFSSFRKMKDRGKSMVCHVDLIQRIGVQRRTRIIERPVEIKSFAINMNPTAHPRGQA